RFAPDANWTIEQGSALDEQYLRSLGKFDVVYSWGVLHHTGDMWKALDLASIPACSQLMIAIYNDQGGTSNRWRWMKRRYNSAGPIFRKLAELFTWFSGWGVFFLLAPFRTLRAYKSYTEQRGMSPWHDVVDWSGGYPFEVAKPERIFEF